MDERRDILLRFAASAAMALAAFDDISSIWQRRESRELSLCIGERASVQFCGSRRRV